MRRKTQWHHGTRTGAELGSRASFSNSLFAAPRRLCSAFIALRSPAMKLLSKRQWLCMGLALLTAVPYLGPGLRAEQRAEDPVHDWGRVRALKPGRQIVVRSFKGMGRKVVGDYASSDAAGIVVRMKDGQEVAIPKERIRQVTRRKRMRYAILIGAAVGFAIFAASTLGKGDFDQPYAALIWGAMGVGPGALGGFAVRRAGRIPLIIYKAPKPPRGQPKNPQDSSPTQQ